MTLEELSQHNDNNNNNNSIIILLFLITIYNYNYYLLLVYVLVLPTDHNIESMLQVVYYFMKDIISMSDFCFELMMSCFSIMHLPTPTPVATMTYIWTLGYCFPVRGVLSPAWFCIVCLFLWWLHLLDFKPGSILALLPGIISLA